MGTHLGTSRWHRPPADHNQTTKCGHGQGSQGTLESTAAPVLMKLDPFCRRILVKLPGKQKTEHQFKIPRTSWPLQVKQPKYTGQEKCFQDMDIQLMDWIMIEMVIKSQMINMRWWTTKFVTSFCATGNRMAHNKQWPTADCPRCSYPQETTSHTIIQCPQQEVQSLWDNTILWLWEQLLQLDTDPGIIKDLSTRLDT